MSVPYITVGNTKFGKHAGLDARELMAQASKSALADAGMEYAESDGGLCGYATALPQSMLSTL